MAQITLDIKKVGSRVYWELKTPTGSEPFGQWTEAFEAYIMALYKARVAH